MGCLNSIASGGGTELIVAVSVAMGVDIIVGGTVGIIVGGTGGVIVGAIGGAIVGKGVVAGRNGCPDPQPDTNKLVANIRRAIVLCFIFFHLL